MLCGRKKNACGKGAKIRFSGLSEENGLVFPFFAYIYSMMTLNRLSAGDRAEIVGIEADGELKERLRMLNIEVGARILVVKTAFFGSTFLVESDGVRMGMRKNPAEKIFVKKLAAAESEALPLPAAERREPE